MTSALFGYSGFVGSTLLRQRAFTHRYRSSDIGDADGMTFDEVVCAAAPAQKWKANKDPEGDLACLHGLMEHLGTLTCKRFLLISTVDVFPSPVDVNEDRPTGEHPEAYGGNRRLLEKFVQQRFDNVYVVRLPGLVGPGLRKNIIFDFQNNNNVSQIDSRASYQFYPMVNLWADLQTMLRHRIRLLHLTAEPVTVREIAEECFGRTFANHVLEKPAAYRFQSKYADLFGASGPYQYSKRETLLATRAYAQSEPQTLS
jgi:nucleoside-diphosphate-sugar epimerase